MYKGEADWTLIREIKNNPRITIPIFGNGDVDSPEKAVFNGGTEAEFPATSTPVTYLFIFDSFTQRVQAIKQ